MSEELEKIGSRMTERLRCVFIEADYEPIEFRSSILLLVSGFVVINPYTAVFSNGITYTIIKSIFSENILGSILLFSAVYSLTAFFSKSLRHRIAATTLQTVIWSVLFVLFLLANTGVWFPWFLGIFALFEGVIVARMATELNRYGS